MSIKKTKATLAISNRSDLKKKDIKVTQKISKKEQKGGIPTTTERDEFRDW